MRKPHQYRTSVGDRRRRLYGMNFIISIFMSVVCFIAKHHHNNTPHHRVYASSNNPTTSIRTSSRRLPFLSPLNSRRAAKEAYLQHLQNELETAQRQLYTSQNTCTSLRKRCEDQRRDTLELIASRGISSRDVDIEVGKEKARQQFIQDQKEEIKRLQGQLQVETEKQKQQVERLNLLSAELKELQVWKEETQEHDNDGKVMELKQQLQDSNQKQNDFAEQVELLALKLEAAEFVAKQRTLATGREEGEEATTWGQRAQLLRSELESVRAKYSTMILNVLESDDQKQNIAEDLDTAIQSVVESALETMEADWAGRYEMLQDQLSNMTDYATSLEEERDAALRRVGEDSSSSSSVQPDKQRGSKQQKQKLREEFSTAELTDTITAELTETLTKQLTETLKENIEKKYKKKLKRLRKELKEQQREMMPFEHQLSHEKQIEDETKKVKKQYELEYESKVQQLEKQMEEQEQLHKERMRKLVKALARKEGLVGESKKMDVVADNTKSSSKMKKKKRETSSSETTDAKDDGDELIHASISSSRKRSKPKIVSVRGNRQ